MVVVEDDPLTRGLLAEMLENHAFEVATASTANDARRAVRLSDADGLVLDVDLGIGPTGFDIADALLATYPHLAVLFLTNLPDSRFAGRDPNSLPAGIGYLRKENLADASMLVTTLDAVLRGKVSEDMRHDRDPDRPMAGLSRTQIDVLRMVALGLSNQDIADARGTTVRAVRNVITRALEAIGTTDADEGHGRVVAARNFMLAAGIPLTDKS
ncbi:MAG: hypothetical protein RL441_178 [Actinomycetota bacterium]